MVNPGRWCELVPAAAVGADRLVAVLTPSIKLIGNITDGAARLELTIPEVQTAAVVGTTGAGKTTISKLIARFYDPTAGRLTLEGVDLRDLSDFDLRRAVVMVTQENFMFDGTVADNIAFGKPDATREEVVRAAEAVGALAFITALPQGYDTDVAKRGSRLSAGQRQLGAFARAFLADPAVLILDEATSSLDVPSERLVQQSLGTILAKRTAVITAHRLSTVQVADRVLVLERESAAVPMRSPPAVVATAAVDGQVSGQVSQILCYDRDTRG